MEDDACPYDYCRCVDLEDTENDLEEAERKLQKCDSVKEAVGKVYDKFVEVSDALDEAIQNADYQLIVDSVSKDFEYVLDDLRSVKNNFDNIDI